MSGQECRGWSYTMGSPNEPDNSNTQYALLGLHAGQQAGAKIDRAVWESIRELYIRTQTEDGGWYYIQQLPSLSPRPTLTMTNGPGFAACLSRAWS